MKRYYVLGPYGDPYFVEANSEQEALDKCIEDEWIEDSWPYDSDFEIISKEKFLSYGYYKDLVNYDFEKNCYWSSDKFCDTVKIDK